MSLRHLPILAVAVLLATAASADTPTTVSRQCDAFNNTSAINGGFDLASGNAPTWNVSDVPFRSLLHSGAGTKVYFHFMPWSCAPGSLDPDQVRRCNGHVVSGYNSNEVETVRRQVANMIERGADGVIVDYYRAPLEDETTLKIRDEAERNAGFEFAVMEDKENYKYAASPEARARKFVDDVAYIHSTYFASPAYMRRKGRPVLFVFQDDSAVDWTAVRAGVRPFGDPLLIFGNDFDHPAADGAFAWIDVGSPISSLDNFYARAKARPNSLVWGVVFAGFDDRLAAWGGKRVVDRRGGMTWLDGFAAIRRNYGPGDELPNLQLATFNDYDEASEIESGIDNGISLAASIQGDTLGWSISGAEETISSFRIFASPSGQRGTLLLRGEVPSGGAHSFDLSTLQGDWEIFVQAQGQPSVRNHMVHAGRHQSGRSEAAPRRHPLFPRSSVSLVSPANCATQRSPLRVVAVEDHGVRATMQIYVDGRLVAERHDTDRIDEQIAIAPGAHAVAAKAWYPSGPGEPVLVNVAIETPAMTISLPAPGATLLSPIRLVGEENTSATVTMMQIYLDGVLHLERPNVEKIDELVPAAPGEHQIALKAWYADGSNALVTVTITAVRGPVTISAPLNGATVTSPFRVVADAPDAAAMQIYLDGTLYVDRQNVQRLDEQVVAGSGRHELAVKAWYSDGSNSLAIIAVTVP
jgi:hypothetical protein